MMYDVDYNNLISSIGESIFQIQNMAYREYRPIAYDLCSREADDEEVAYYLDRMVGFCGTDNMLNLFKMVCRRYLYIYPDLIAFEIQTYKEMFDSEQDTSRATASQEA